MPRPRRKPAAVPKPERQAVAKFTSRHGEKLEAVLGEVREFRRQQAQTETHLSHMTELLARLSSAGPFGYATLLQAHDRMEKLLNEQREKFREVEADIAKLQEYVGVQSRALERLRLEDQAGRSPDLTGPTIARGAG